MSRRTLFHGLSFGVGLSTLAGASLVLAGPEELARTRISDPVADALGILLLLGVILYVVLCATLRRPLKGFGHSVKLPSGRSLTGSPASITRASALVLPNKIISAST